tara:strand:+ start:287 stop:643 length:357 start_codon:yes stop_codon:yes gene_type:complete
MTYKQYGGDRMSSPLTQKRVDRVTDRDEEMSNTEYQKLKSKRARKHGGMTENEMNRMRERAYSYRRNADDRLMLQIDSHLPPRPSYEGWTDFQIKQAEAHRDRQKQGIRNSILEERFS